MRPHEIIESCHKSQLCLESPKGLGKSEGFAFQMRIHLSKNTIMLLNERSVDFRAGGVHHPFIDPLHIPEYNTFFHFYNPPAFPSFVDSDIIEIICRHAVRQPRSPLFTRMLWYNHFTKFLLKCRRIGRQFIRCKKWLAFFTNNVSYLTNKLLTAFLFSIAHKKCHQQSGFRINGGPYPGLASFAGFTTFFSTKDHNSSICASVSCKSTKSFSMTLAQYFPALRIT